MPLLGRFKSLVSVDFKMDELLEFSSDMTEVDPEVASELEQCQDKRNQQFKDMLSFVRKHTELFPGQLQEVDCPLDISWGGEEIRCRSEIWEELYWLVQSKKELSEITTFNWGLVTRRIHEVNLGSVNVFNLQALSEEEAGYASDLLSNQPPILSRYRSLRKLSLGVLGESFSLKWAVDVKLASNRCNALDHTLDAVGGSAMIVSPFQKQLPLIPLEVISISIPSSSQSVLDDLAYAFGDTLKEITVEIYVAEGNTENTPSVRVGQDWRLPQLRTINIWSEDVRLLIDPDLLQGMTENLEKIDLFDKSSRHQCWDLCLISPPPNPLARLHTVNLHGAPAVLFHPDTLLKTTNLKILFLGTERGEFDASLEEESLGKSGDTQQDRMTPGDHFPHWSWNWNLPSLDYLHLEGEFAYYFSFRMLDGCPSLRHLWLELQGRSRALELQDFISVPSSETTPSTGGNFCSENPEVISSSVAYLYLDDGWEMTNELLPILFTTVFRNMLWLEEYRTTGYSLQGWLAALKGHSRLIGARCGLQRTGDDEMIAEGMGLVSKPLPPGYQFHGKEVFNDDSDRPLFFFSAEKTWYYGKESS